MDATSRLAQIAAVQARYEDSLMALPGAVGVGIAYRWREGRQTGELCLTLLVRRKLALAELATEDVAPRELDGVGVDVIESGAFAIQRGEAATRRYNRRRQPGSSRW